MVRPLGEVLQTIGGYGPRPRLKHISSGLPSIATVNADIRNRRSVASDQ